MSEANPLAEFLAMGGYAVYVWPAYIIAIATIAGLALRTHLQWRRWKARVQSLEKSGNGAP
jgi:heme exporter protein D